MKTDAEVDRLYQLPLEEFTAARNALAKGAGKDASRIRALVKPPLAAWAVNQLYWQDRRTWDRLVDAAAHLRRVNAAVLAGRQDDVRAAGQVHDAAVQEALKAAVALLARGGHPATDTARQAIVSTLRALPGDEPPGRLTRALQPGGFEVLAGLSVAPRAGRGKPPAPPADKPAKASPRPHADARALTHARHASAAAERALHEAEQAARRHEFEAARFAREEERAEKAVDQARAALAAATRSLEDAEREHETASERRGAAATAARKSADTIAGARRSAHAAAAALKKLQG